MADAAQRRARYSQSGYMLLAVLIMATLAAIAAAAMLPRVAQEIRREREEELVHRGTQYARAIKKFYRKNGRYPARLEALESSNNIRYLRKRYKDPVTGKDQWRLIHFGEAKFMPRTFGNQPAGSATPGAAATASGSQQNSPPGQNIPTNTNGPATPSGTAAGGSTAGGAAGGSSSTSSAPGSTAGGTGSSTGGGLSSSSTPSSSGSSSSSSSSGSTFLSSNNNQTFGGAPIVGVSSTSDRESLKELNGRNHYNEWEFVYDPRFDTNVGAGGIGAQPPRPGAQPANPPGTPPTVPPMSPPPVPR